MGKQVNSEKPSKWEFIYEDDESISIWKYDSKITTNGPVSVEQKYKKGFDHWLSKKKTLGDLVKEDKKSTKSKSSKP